MGLRLLLLIFIMLVSSANSHAGSLIEYRLVYLEAGENTEKIRPVGYQRFVYVEIEPLLTLANIQSAEIVDSEKLMMGRVLEVLVKPDHFKDYNAKINAATEKSESVGIAVFLRGEVVYITFGIHGQEESEPAHWLTGVEEEKMQSFTQIVKGKAR